MYVTIQFYKFYKFLCKLYPVLNSKSSQSKKIKSLSSLAFTDFFSNTYILFPIQNIPVNSHWRENGLTMSQNNNVMIYLVIFHYFDQFFCITRWLICDLETLKIVSEPPKHFSVVNFENIANISGLLP